MQPLIEIIRPNQWYKNLIALIAIIFSLNLFNVDLWFLSLIGFVALCLSSGASYIINDVLDRNNDIFHPKKSKRPIPSGRLSVRQAITYAIVLIIVSESIAIFLGDGFFIINSLLIVLTNLYSIWLKNILVLESLLISVNYVLRALAGVFAIGVSLSPWLIIGVFLVALALVLRKRKTEILFLNDSADLCRPVLKHYTSKLLNGLIIVTLGTVISAYTVYSIRGPPGIDDWRLVLTVPLVSFILIRYVYGNRVGEYSITELDAFLMLDKQLLGSIVAYTSLVILLLYLAPDSYFR